MLSCSALLQKNMTLCVSFQVSVLLHWLIYLPYTKDFPHGSAGKESTYNAGDLGSIPGLGRSPEEGNGYPLQYSGLENSMDCIIHRVTKSQTWLRDFHFHPIPKNAHFRYYNFILNFKMCWYMLCNFIHDHLAILASLHFHIYLRVTLSIYTRKAAGFVMIELNI